MSSGSPVESVRRAFALLEELNRQRINSVQHLHEVTALPKSTIVRLCDLPCCSSTAAARSLSS